MRERGIRAGTGAARQSVPAIAMAWDIASPWAVTATVMAVATVCARGSGFNPREGLRPYPNG
jgi:hypothetical protein